MYAFLPSLSSCCLLPSISGMSVLIIGLCGVVNTGFCAHLFSFTITFPMNWSNFVALFLLSFMLNNSGCSSINLVLHFPSWNRGFSSTFIKNPTLVFTPLILNSLIDLNILLIAFLNVLSQETVLTNKLS